MNKQWLLVYLCVGFAATGLVQPLMFIPSVVALIIFGVQEILNERPAAKSLGVVEELKIQIKNMEADLDKTNKDLTSLTNKVGGINWRSK